MSVKRVTLKPRWWEGTSTPEVVVLIDEDGNVTHEDGTPIGCVEKSSRTYSPPTHKGSRIAKCHKDVPEWHGWRPDTPRYGLADVRRDTRIDVLRELMRERS
jgi:hypothetical protein